MFLKNRRPGLCSLFVVVAFLASILAPFPDVANSSDKLTSGKWEIPVSGWFTSQTVPDCPDGAILCTEGSLTGLLSTYDFVMWNQTSDPTNPSESYYTGYSTIKTRSSHTLFSYDTGNMYVLRGGNEALFVTNIHFIDGTGPFSNASGSIVAIGLLDFQTGESSGFYFGAIVL